MQRTALASDAARKVEPIVLRLHSRRCLDTAHGLDRRRRKPPCQVAAHRLVAPGEAELPAENRVQHLRLIVARAVRHDTPIVKRREHRVDALLPARQRRRSNIAAVGGVHRPTQPIPQRRLIDAQLRGNLSDHTPRSTIS